VNVLYCRIFQSFFVHIPFYSDQVFIAPKMEAIFSYITIIIGQKTAAYISIDADAIHAMHFSLKIYALKNTKATVLFYLAKQTEHHFRIMHVTVHADDYAQIRYQFALYDNTYLKKEIIARSDGNQSNIEIIGKYIATPHTQLYCDTYQYHEHPDTQSNVTVEGVSTKHSSVTHQGFIFIAPRATGTRTKQSSKHITLSKTVHVHAQPILDVQNNTVSCSHASAIGTINQEMIFYMSSRGVSTHDATFLAAQTYALLNPTHQIEHALYARAKRILQSALRQL